MRLQALDFPAINCKEDLIDILVHFVRAMILELPSTIC